MLFRTIKPRNHLYAFAVPAGRQGMVIKERSWSSSSYRFGFNGQEMDDEVAGDGNSYTAQFWQYDSRLGRRWNVDPVYSNAASNYQSFSNRPIVMVDPNGNSDYYSARGKYLGSDGTNKTDIMIVTDSRVRRQLKKGNRKALRKNSYVNNGSIDDKAYFVIPPYEHRQQIKEIMSTYNPNGNYEIGGRGIKFSDDSYEHIRAKDGEIVKDGEVAEIDLSSTHKDDIDKADKTGEIEVIYSWHAHTKKQYFFETKPGSGEYVSLKDLKRATGNSTQANRNRKEIGGPTPSEHDYINATVKGNFAKLYYVKEKGWWNRWRCSSI
jgi:RHS repeat-associated protein